MVEAAGSVAAGGGGDSSDAEPTFNAATQTMILDDNMEAYTDVASMGDPSVVGTYPRIVPNPSHAVTPDDVDPTKNIIITPGRGGTGQALRLFFSGAYQDSSKWVTMNIPVTPDLATHYMQYWGRVTLSAPLPPDVALAVKWFMGWNKHTDPLTRVEWNTRYPSIDYSGLDPNPTVWQVINGNESNTNGDQPVGPHPADVWDGQWHRFTYSYRSNTSAGSRDGFARMWVDGTKIIDVSLATAGVTPPGGIHQWCSLIDVDNLVAADGIDHIDWGWTQTTDTPAWTYDIDDVKWWIDGDLA